MKEKSPIGQLLICFALSLLVATALASPSLQTDVIVFSYNRPLQLNAFLESLYLYVTGFSEITVIYAADTKYESSYRNLAQSYKKVLFSKQALRGPSGDFKQLTTKALKSSLSTYIIFAVDDLIFTDYVNLSECTLMLENTNAYAFYLRLGKNITHCFTLNTFTGLPEFTVVANGIYSWQFKTGKGDWCYRHSLDGTIFLKSSIDSYLTNINYHSPNTLEGQWSAYINMNGYGLCYAKSKIVNLVLNLVQKDYMNPDIALQYENKRYYHPAYLLKKYNQGFKIDITQLHRIANKAPHIGDYQPKFIRL